MTPAAARIASHVVSIQPKKTSAARIVAMSSHASRRNSAVLRYRALSATIIRTRSAPRRPASASPSARDVEKGDRAASAAASTPATSTKAAARMSSCGSPPIGDATFAFSSRLPLGEQSRLQREHLSMLLGLGVVVAEQVQDPVDREQVQLVFEGMSGLAGLARGHL